MDVAVDQLMDPPAAPQSRRSRRRPFRRDIEGLRAVAIVAVVLYHAHLGAIPGGYVGVDVFFVISGYLITDHLWREVRDKRRLSFRGFYARRIRRLLPASFLVLAATAVASAALLPPLEARSVLKDGVACALYVGNYRFAVQSTNYLTASAPASPYQQYWSLGVEEQFYLIWPAVLLLASMAWRHRRPSRSVAATVLAVLAVSSCAFSIWLTNANEPWAFFSLSTRAWELAVGGLVALLAPELGQLRIRPLLGWLGLGLIAWAVFTFTATTAFPGTAALLPVLGAAAVIAAGCGRAPRNGPVRILRTAPMQVTGRVSYSWYLWHWPFLILVPVAVGHPLSLVQNLSVAVISFVVATITFVVVERPVRTWRWFTADTRRSLSLGFALSLGAVGVCLLSVLSLPNLSGTGQAPVASAALEKASSTAKAADATRVPSNPLLAELDENTAAINQQVASSLTVEDIPSNLEPSLPDANADEPPVFVNGCLDSYTDTTLRPCISGDTTSNTTVILFGDSHAAMWYPAVNAAAERFGWKLITWTKATCPPFPLPIFSPVLGRTFTECDDWRQDVLNQIAVIHPALVILGVAHHYTDIYNFTPYSPVWISGLGEEVHDIRDLGAHVMVFGPVPKPPFDVPSCLSGNLTSATTCTVAVGVGLNASGMAAETTAVEQNGGTYVDTEPWFCTTTTCPTMVDNLVVYRDDNHITSAYADFLTPVVEPALERAIAGQPVADYQIKQ